MATASSASAGDPTLLKDVNTDVSETSSDPGAAAALGGIRLFAATDATGGRELWKTDGTAAGTARVKDVWPGVDSSDPSGIAVRGGLAYFLAKDPVNSLALWRTDGTEAGTQMLVGLYAGAEITVWPELPGGPQLVSVVDTGSSTSVLWKTDGTASGTVLVHSGPTTFNSLGLLERLGSAILFSGTSAAGGIELWRTDGTAAGTVQVLDIFAGAGSSNPQPLGVVNGKLVFSAFDSSVGFEPWASDGTTAGTIRLAETSPTTGGGPSSSGAQIVGARLVFAAFDPLEADLWSTDGTPGGTALVANLNLTAITLGSRPATLGGVLVFTANEKTTTGLEPWVTDGTAGGTHVLADLVAGTGNSSPFVVARTSTRVFFTATTAAAGREMWSTDGTAAGTQMLGNIGPGASNGVELAQMMGADGSAVIDGTTLCFLANDATTGAEVWRTDGTAAQTFRTRDVQPNDGSVPQPPSLLGVLPGRALFAANDGSTGRELWGTDGTTAGTSLLADLHAGLTQSSDPSGTVVGDTFWFTANDPSIGFELWKSDGTPGGTALVKDLLGGPGSSSPSGFEGFGGQVWFTAFDGASGRTLWRTDGTAGGTSSFWTPPAGTTEVLGPWSAEGRLFLLTTTPALGGKVLWATDGSSAPTVAGAAAEGIVAVVGRAGGHLYLNVFDGSDVSLRRTNGVGSFALIRSGATASPLYYRGFDAPFANGRAWFLTEDSQVLSTDGSAAGTSLVGVTKYEVTLLEAGLVAKGGTVYFGARDLNTSELGLWRTDGTDAGTFALTEGNFMFLYSAGPVGPDLFFMGWDASHGWELWKTNGTAAGTVRVVDVAAGAPSSSPWFFSHFDGTTWFLASAQGVEPVPESQYTQLWKTDGTPGGTVPVKAFGGRYSIASFNDILGVSTSALFLSADDHAHGRELWGVYAPPPPPPPPPATDTDGDGLLDAWETDGYTAADGTFIDLPKLGASPLHKDVFVEIDYMVAADHTHKPLQSAIDRIVAAFAAAPVSNPDGRPGIRLYVKVDEAIPHVNVLGTLASPSSYVWKQFDDIRAQRFPAALGTVWHYCVFAHDLPVWASGQAPWSGIARGEPSSHFIVSLGSFIGGVGTDYQQAGTLMHELGHNFGLRHGGTEATNFKPNYLSVMNYSFQVTGLRSGGLDGTFDYSRVELPPLDEAALSEPGGIVAGDPAKGFGTKWWVHYTTTERRVDTAHVEVWITDLANGAMDWNASGGRQPDRDPVKADANNDLTTLVPLRGAEDWSRLIFKGGTVGFGRGTDPAPPLPDVTLIDELDLATAKIVSTPRSVNASSGSALGAGTGTGSAPSNGGGNGGGGTPPGGGGGGGGSGGGSGNGSGNAGADPYPTIDGITGTVSKGHNVITWTPVGPRNDWTYRIYRSVDGGPLLLLATTQNSEYQDKDVTAGKTYAYAVSVLRADGWESWPTDSLSLKAK